MLFGADQPTHQQVWMSHFDSITEAPDGFAVTASTADAPAAAFEDAERGIYGVQFHPEVVHTPHGQERARALPLRRLRLPRRRGR